jgi:hypothetical protein
MFLVERILEERMMLPLHCQFQIIYADRSLLPFDARVHTMLMSLVSSDFTKTPKSIIGSRLAFLVLGRPGAVNLRWHVPEYHHNRNRYIG